MYQANKGEQSTVELPSSGGDKCVTEIRARDGGEEFSCSRCAMAHYMLL